MHCVFRLLICTEPTFHVTNSLNSPPTPPAGSTECFPVRRVWCVGKNYAKHARELNADPADIVFFTKSAHCVVPGEASSIPFPRNTKLLHHEIELVVAIGEKGVDLSPQEADKIIFGYAVGLDLTLRDLQNMARNKGNPWCVHCTCACTHAFQVYAYACTQNPTPYLNPLYNHNA